MQAVLLAAGAGQRLRPVTLERSKATVPICGLAMVERILAGLAAAGIDDFVAVVKDPGDDVAECCRRWAGQRSIRFAVQTERKGMAHALMQAAPLIEGDFIVSACDSILEDAFLAGLVAQHRERRATATLALERVTTPEAIRKTAIVTLDGESVTSIVEKPEPSEAPSDISSLPVYVFTPRVLDYLPLVPLSQRGEYELQDAIARLIRVDGGVGGRLASVRWQVTTVDDLLAVNRTFLTRGETRADPRAECVGAVYVDPDAVLGEGCRIGPDAVLEAGCRIGAGAVVRDAVVLRGAVVEDGQEVSGCVVASA